MLDIESVRNGNCNSRKPDLSAYMNKQVKDLVAYLTSFKDGDFLIHSADSLDTVYRIKEGNIVEADHRTDDCVIKSCDMFIKQGEPVRISIGTTSWQVAVREMASAIEVLAYYLAKKGASVESPLYLGSNAAELAIELVRLGFTSIDDPVVQLVGELWAGDYCMYTSLVYSATNILRIAQTEIVTQITADDQREVVVIALYIAGKLGTKKVYVGSDSIGHDAVELAIELYKHGYKTIAEPIVSIAAEMYTGSSACLIVQNAANTLRDIHKSVYSDKTKVLLWFK